MSAAHAVHRRAAGALFMGTLALLLVACAGITPKRMVPETTGPERKIAQSVRVMPVTGTRDTFFGGPPFPPNEKIHEAVVATLEKAGIFAAVSSSAGDLELTVTVLSQDQQGFVPTTARMVANYKFTARGGALIWSENYDSSFSDGALGGAARTVAANEGAVRENLQAFVQGLRERWRP